MKIIPIFLTLLLSGCVSQTLPPKVPESSLKIDNAISIKPHQHPVYSESLQAAIEGTEIFTQVTTNDTSDTTAKVNRQVHGSAVIPLLTILSLGIIPTTVEEEFGKSFILVHRGKTHEIEATWNGNTILGWAALPMNLSPNRTMGNPEKHPRFAAFLRSKIAEAIAR